MSQIGLKTIFKERKEFCSQLKSSPSYSINANKKLPYKIIITKEHVQEMLGKDAPGVGSYNNDK
jgi:hypothetical protein